MSRIVAAASLALLAACGSQGESGATPGQPAASPTALTAAPAAQQAAATPDLATCPARSLLEEGLRQRTAPIAVPAALREVMRSGMDNFAVVTLAGATVCVDASWMEAIRNPVLSPDGRFVSFDWDGYEAFGHVIVDRAGRGTEIDTGVPGFPSPSGKLLAAADLSESSFGALNAFAVWRIEPETIRELASHDEVPPANDWRIDGWAGEACVDLSAIPWDRFTGDADDPRTPFRARAENGWHVVPGACAEA